MMSEFMDGTAVILSPEFVRLRDEVERLRTELSMALLERDELQFVVCKNIENLYMLQVGYLEYKVYEAQCKMLRLKRKIELVQARMNRQETVDVAAIEDALDVEFEEYQKQLDDIMHSMNDAIEHGQAEHLTLDESKELKQLYRHIVKNLHPDLNPDCSEEQLRLFENAVNAYKNGDLHFLRIIREMVSDYELPLILEDAMTMLISEKERLLELITGLYQSMYDIRSRYPYTVKEIVEDPDKIKERRRELETVFTQYEEMIKLYEERLDDMLR